MQRDLSIDCSYIYQWFAKSATVSVKPMVSGPEILAVEIFDAPCGICKFCGHPRGSQTKSRMVLVGIRDLTKKEQLVHQNNVLEGVIHWHMPCKFEITDLSNIISKRSPSSVAAKGISFSFCLC